MSGSAVLAHQIVDGKASHESMGMKWDVNTAYCACRRKNIDLIQDLHFPAACQRLKISPDGATSFCLGHSSTQGDSIRLSAPFMHVDSARSIQS